MANQSFTYFKSYIVNQFVNEWTNFTRVALSTFGSDQYLFGSFNSSAQFISTVNNLTAQANHPLYWLVGIFYLYIYSLILFSDPF